jgi:hypothetical protein
LLRKLGKRLKVVALIDPATEHAKNVLRKKCELSSLRSAYENTKVYKSIDEYAASKERGELRCDQLIIP